MTTGRFQVGLPPGAIARCFSEMRAPPECHFTDASLVVRQRSAARKVNERLLLPLSDTSGSTHASSRSGR